MFIDGLAERVRVMTETKVVSGLMFRVTHEELQKHLQARAAYHEKRAKDKQAEIPKLEEAVAKLHESIATIKGQSRDTAPVPSVSNKTVGYGFDGSHQVSQLEQQIDQLHRDIRDHLNKASSFAFLATSLFPMEYALPWADLQVLEIVK